MNALYLLFIGELILVFWVLAYTKTDIISPSFIMVAMFIISTFSVIINEKYWCVEFKYKTTFIVLSGLFAVCLLEFILNIFYNNKKERRNDTEKFTSIEYKKVYSGTGVLFVLFTSILMIIYILAVYKNGGGKSLITSIGVVHVDDEIDIGVIPTIAIRILNKVAYPCVFILAYNAVTHNIKKCIWLLIPTMESCIAIFFSGVRSTYLYIIFAFLLYYIILYRYRYGWKSVKIKTYIKPLIIMILIFLFIFVGSRAIVKNHEFSSTGFQYITFYLGSPLHLFNKIIDDLDMGLPMLKQHYIGTHSFTWLYRELYRFGILKIETIDITRFVSVGGGYYGGGNVFTIFSSALQDFGLIGMYIYLIGIFYLIFRCYYKNIKYSKSLEKSELPLLVYGVFSNYYLMAFYCALSKQFKLQTILEIIIMIIIYKALTSLKIVIKK